MTMALEGGEGSAPRPGRSLPPGKTRTHCTGGWVGPRVGLDRCGKFRLPPGFDPRAVQPVASRYTDYATRPTITFMVREKSLCHHICMFIYLLLFMYPTIRFCRCNRSSSISRPDTESHQQLIQHNYVRVTNYI